MQKIVAKMVDIVNVKNAKMHLEQCQLRKNQKNKKEGDFSWLENIKFVQNADVH